MRGILPIILIFLAAAGAWAQVVPALPAELGRSMRPPDARAPHVAQSPETPLLPDTARTAAVAAITGIEWSSEGKVGKLVIRLDGPVNFRAVTSRERITLDLWRADRARWQTILLEHEYARRIRVRQYTPQLARIYIDLKRPARYKTFVRTDPHQIAVMVIPPWMATVKLPPSLFYEKFRAATGSGSTAVHVLRVDPRAPDIQVRPVLAGDVGTGMETTSVIATRYDALAGVNGGYFAGSGAPLGMMVINGKLVSAPLPKRTVFAISREGTPVIRAFEFSGRVVTTDRTRLWVSAVNRPPHADGIAVYTPDYGPLTPSLGIAVLVRNDVVDGFTSGRLLIPEDGYVLTANQEDAYLLRDHLAVGERVWLRLQIAPAIDILNALGGGPRLVKDGTAFVPSAWEWFTFRFHAKREPRTAVGITKAGKLVFATVDGRSSRNTGMTLQELAALMVQLGAVEAMNLDGGGSATMVVGGRTVNEPSDGAERPIGSALLVLRTEP